MILILILDGTAEIQSLGWERGWPLCGPAAPCTSLLGCSSSFGILRKQAAFLQDGDRACHHGFPETAVLWEGQEGCVFAGEGQKKERMFNFQEELHGPQIAPRGQRNLKLFRFFLIECLFQRGIPFHLVTSDSEDSDSTCSQRLAALCCGTGCPLKGQAARANSASEACMTDITSRME